MVRGQVHKLEKWCGKELGFDPVAYLDESTGLLQDIEAAVADVDFFRKKKFASVEELGTYRVVLYALIRLFQPSFFVETGVLHGLTSVFLLQALADNGHGRLISVDLPSYFESGPANKDGFDDTLPPGKEPGWVIPERLLPYWSLRLGSSRDLLPAIAEECADEPTIFLHDSDHTMENMRWELECAWDKMAGVTMLVADNVDFNTAFFDFAYDVRRIPFTFQDTSGPLRFGIIQKTK